MQCTHFEFQKRLEKQPKFEPWNNSKWLPFRLCAVYFNQYTNQGTKRQSLSPFKSSFDLGRKFTQILTFADSNDSHLSCFWALFEIQTWAWPKMAYTKTMLKITVESVRWNMRNLELNANHSTIFGMFQYFCNNLIVFDFKSFNFRISLLETFVLRKRVMEIVFDVFICFTGKVLSC